MTSVIVIAVHRILTIGCHGSIRRKSVGWCWWCYQVVPTTPQYYNWAKSSLPTLSRSTLAGVIAKRFDAVNRTESFVGFAIGIFQVEQSNSVSTSASTLHESAGFPVTDSVFTFSWDASLFEFLGMFDLHCRRMLLLEDILALLSYRYPKIPFHRPRCNITATSSQQDSLRQTKRKGTRETRVQ